MGELPKWIDQLLTPMNDFIEKVTLALTKRLTFEDNFLGSVASYEFTDDVELEINPNLTASGNLRVSGVLPLSTGGEPFTKFGWVQKANGNIGVTFGFETTSAKRTCKIAILLG